MRTKPPINTKVHTTKNVKKQKELAGKSRSRKREGRESQNENKSKKSKQMKNLNELQQAEKKKERLCTGTRPESGTKPESPDGQHKARREP